MRITGFTKGQNSDVVVDFIAVVFMGSTVHFLAPFTGAFSHDLKAILIVLGFQAKNLYNMYKRPERNGKQRKKEGE